MRHKHSATEDPVKLVGFAAIAGAIGAVVAMLITPKNGNQVRNGIKRRAGNFKETLRDKVEDNIETVGDTDLDSKQRTQTKADSAVKEVKSKATTAAAKAKSVPSKTTDAAAKAKKTVRKTPPKSQ
jgi:gas vesicle protein